MKEERLLQGLRERIRDVRQGPDGALYLLTDNAPGASCAWRRRNNFALESTTNTAPALSPARHNLAAIEGLLASSVG